MKSTLASTEVVIVQTKKVSCNGGSGASNHPLVYLNMGEEDFIICPYCSKYFSIKENLNSHLKVSH